MRANAPFPLDPASANRNRLSAFIVLLGVLYAALYAWGGYLQEGDGFSWQARWLIEGLAHLFILPVILLWMRPLIHGYVLIPLSSNSITNRFTRYEHFPYLVLGASLGFLAGLKPEITLAIKLLLILALTQCGLFLHYWIRQNACVLPSPKATLPSYF